MSNFILIDNVNIVRSGEDLEYNYTGCKISSDKLHLVIVKTASDINLRPSTLG